MYISYCMYCTLVGVDKQTTHIEKASTHVQDLRSVQLSEGADATNSCLLFPSCVTHLAVYLSSLSTPYLFLCGTYIGLTSR